MLRFLWNSWWRNKERFLLLLVGVLILSTGLSYLIGVTQANKATVVDELQKRWESSYHIIVRPPGSRSVTEDLNLLEPNYLSGLDGGITMEQYHLIKSMAEVDIAAPIAMMGSFQTQIELDGLNVDEPGIYRLNIKEETDTGAEIEKFEGNTYLAIGDWRPSGIGDDYGATPFGGNLSYGSDVLIAGIDPEAESLLVGIDEAIIKSENSRFFAEEDTAQEVQDMGLSGFHIPVIISNQDYVDASMTYTIEKLEFPFGPTEQTQTMEDIREKGGKEYLEEKEGTFVKEFVYTTEDVHSKLINGILNPSESSYVGSDDFKWLPFKPSPVNYQPVESPFGNRWPFAYQVQPYEVPEDSLLAVRHMYRPVKMFGQTSEDWPRIKLDYIGVFDPQKLQVSKDPLTELPMETYYPAKAQWVVNSENQPVNPPTDMKPLNNPYGFLTKPPLILTTIDAAAKVLGEEPISAIRVNVKGVEELNEESETKLQAVVKEIEEKTGLITDVTLGSSPQLALTYLPGLEGEEALGWVQQPWIKLGSSISIFQETKVGMSGVIASVILVAVVYVFASNIIMLFARKKEFAVLQSLGWRPTQLTKLLLLESTILGALVALISWLILGIFMVTGADTSLLRVILIGMSGLAVYWLGSLIPILLVKRIKPYESMKAGEVSHRARRLFRSHSVFGMSMNQLVTQWPRSILSVIAISVPTSLFIFFLFITFRLKGVLYTTWLGEFVALEVGTMHYVAMAVALLIAILTTTEIMWQNVSERQPQIAVLKATGWQNTNVRLLVLLEGAITGLLAGIIGLVIALLLILKMYTQFPVEEMGFLLLTLLIPILTGIVGALLPAEKAVRTLPNQAINGVANNSKKIEKQFKWGLGAAGAGLVIGILSLFIYAIPENVDSTTGTVGQNNPTERTSGKLLSTESEPTPNDVPAKEEDQPTGVIEQLQKDAYRSYKLGDGTDAKSNFRLGNLVETPTGISLTSEKNRLISIPVTLEELDVEPQHNGASTVYKPQGFKLIDDAGNEYKIVNMEVTEKGQWKNQYKFTIPSKTTVILTYEIPIDLDRVVFFAQGNFIPGPVVVEMQLKELPESSYVDSAEREHQPTGAIEQLQRDAYRSYRLGDGTDEKSNFRLGNLVDNPTGILLTSKKNRLLSIPVTLDGLDMDPMHHGSFTIYKPQGFKLIDDSGNEYKTVNMEVTEKGQWEHQFKFIYPSKTTVILTYEIPIEVNQVVFVAQGDFTPGQVVVEIPLEEE